MNLGIRVGARARSEDSYDLVIHAYFLVVAQFDSLLAVHAIHALYV